MSDLAKRMREAADTLEEVGQVYEYMNPEHSQWSAATLRSEAYSVEEDEL